MKSYLSFFLLIVFVSCNQNTNNNEPNSEERSMAGYWTGEGQFSNNEMKDEYGLIDFRLTISEDNSVKGTVGDAALSNGVITLENGRFDLVAKLDGKIKSDSELEKQHVVVFGSIPDGNEVHTDFQIKNNLFFDFSMRQGGVSLVKNE